MSDVDAMQTFVCSILVPAACQVVYEGTVLARPKFILPHTVRYPRKKTWMRNPEQESTFFSFGGLV
jgi:hypothetical protein